LAELNLAGTSLAEFVDKFGWALSGEAVDVHG
jgi:hypothetical protein